MSTAPPITYLILAHEDPFHLSALTNRLDAPGVRFHVHVDAKADIMPFRRLVAALPNVRFCEPRVAVTWAAFSVVEATLRLVEAALDDEGRCGRLVLLSGADYPLATNAEIRRFFEQHPRRQFIRRFPILEGDPVQAWKVRGRHFRGLAPRHSLWRLPLFGFERALRVVPRRMPRDWPLMCGSQWWALTADCARYCLEFPLERPDILRFFRNVFAPDETFFHSVVHNSIFAGNAEPVEAFSHDVTTSGSLACYANLHHLPGTTISTSEHAAVALRSGKLFARKFSSRSSIQAVRAIDRHLGSGAAGAIEPSRPIYAREQ
ncbi:MAG TPA: beta-1,6-N-acetylglucosaminyltransferase [Xanthobacteraceae bacterium]